MYPHSVSYIIGVLHCSDTFVIPRNQHWYITVNRLPLHFTSFPINVLFLPQDPIQGTTLHLIIAPPPPPPLCDSSSVFPCLS